MKIKMMMKRKRDTVPSLMSEQREQAPAVELARYPTLAIARESALALAAKEMPYMIKRDGPEWVLSVDEGIHAAALEELRDFEAEQSRRPPPPSAPLPLEKIRPLSLFAAGWFLCACFFLQLRYDPAWIERGEASSEAIVHHGEWWRVVTALTLHGDLSHLVANLATGLLFAAFLLPQFGTGLTWTLILLTGIAGNGINAWTYRAEPHDSIGASTAVFGALGLLVGRELWARWAHPATRSRWQLVVPLGAGLSLLAYLGVGDKHESIDYMAHLWGFLSGIAFGLNASASYLKQRITPAGQKIAAVLVPLIVIAAWCIAFRHR